MALNPGWTGNPPLRTGVPTIRQALAIVCRLLAVFTPIIKTYLEADKHVYVDALNQACSDFMDNVPAPRP